MLGGTAIGMIVGAEVRAPVIGRAHGLDKVTVIGEDGLMTAEAGERTIAKFATKDYDLPTHLPFAEQLLDELVSQGFDMAYSQDAELGHSFAAVFEWVIGGRKIPVVPIFVNTYLPPITHSNTAAKEWPKSAS